VLGATFFAAGQGMTAHEGDARRHATVQGANEGSFGAAGIGQQGTRLAFRRRYQDLLGEEVHRRAENGDIRVSHGFPKIEKALVDRPSIQGLPQARLAAPHSQNAFGQPALFRCQPDRPADQADADDG